MRRHRGIKVLGVLLVLFISYKTIFPLLALNAAGNQGKTVQDGDAAAGSEGGETLVGWIVDKLASGEVELSDETSIRQAIAEGERELDITLAQKDKDAVVGFMRTLDNIETGAEDFMEQAKEMYQKYSAEFVEETNDAINEAVESAAKSAGESFADSLKNAVTDFLER